MKKITVFYGKDATRVELIALGELSEILRGYTNESPALVPCTDSSDQKDDGCVNIYIGTRENNPYIRSHPAAPLTKKESYRITARENTVIIEGFDGAGVLYGAIDFYNEYLVLLENPGSDEIIRNPFSDEVSFSFDYSSAPSVSERGLWTWGHVIYDYRGYLDNMMRLKMNSVIIWNDFLPTNAKDVIEYAHERNIKVIWGFAWLWDTACARFDLTALEGESERILAKYEREYKDAPGDGIYFQTFTELKTDNIDGVIIAKAAAEFVNKTAALFYKSHPNLEIQFGIHATSVKERLEFIATVDPRIRIVWEDCGAFPFSYDPCDVSSFDETMDFVDKIAALRGEGELFGAVTKGLSKLDWSKFEHQTEAAAIGIAPDPVKKAKTEKKARMWRYRQAFWLINSDKAKLMIDRMCALSGGASSIFGLVEDGMLEEAIPYPVALYSELLWSAGKKNIDSLISSVALRSNVRFY